MASICCPHCLNEIKTPSSALPWIIGIVAALGMGMFMLIVCLGAITAIGASANESFNEIAVERDAEAVATEIE